MVVFRPDGLGIVDLQKFYLVDAGEKHRWSCEFDKLAFCNLMYLPQFTDVSHKVWRVG